MIPLPEPDWLHLKPFGYAPGSYMSRCMHCTNVVPELDKRAVSCRPCAAKVHEIDRLRKEADAVRAEERERCAAICNRAMPQPAMSYNDVEITEALRLCVETIRSAP